MTIRFTTLKASADASVESHNISPNISPNISLLFLSRWGVLSLCVYLSMGCADKIRAVDNTAPVMMYEPSQLVIDSTSYDEWLYFDLDIYLDDPMCMETCRGTDEEELSGWDIAFQRFKIMSNGGVSGSGGVEIAIIKDQEYAEVINAPEDGYDFDQEDSEDDEDSDPDYVFNQADSWFSYDLMTHSLSTKDYIYVVHTTDDQYVKIAIDDYYNEVGDSGYFDLQLEELSAP